MLFRISRRVARFLILPALVSGLLRAAPEDHVRVEENVVYREEGEWQGLMDLYLPESEAPNPIVVTIHGGAWRHGSKDRLREYRYYLREGFAVANVGYRLAQVAPAPGAVTDIRCAMAYLVEHAEELNIDPQRMIIAGGSAGGHLAMMAGLLDHRPVFEGDCVAAAPYAVAGIVVKAGISRLYATNADGEQIVLPDSAVTEWFAERRNDLQLAKALSPLEYVTPQSPPMMLVHGNADRRVPYTQAVEMDARLTAAGVPHRFFTVEGGDHATAEKDKPAVYAAISAFLEEIIPKAERPALNPLQ
jgi:acetyl esterase/lipase